MKKISFFLLFVVVSLYGFVQKYNVDSALTSLRFKKDSSLHAMKHERDSVYQAGMHADSAKIEKQYKEKIRWAHLNGIAIYPAMNGGDMSGVIPVEGITEFPDAKMDYKLLFELTNANPDSVANEINYSLTEAVRKINLHATAGVPLKRIIPVFVIHGDGLWAFTTNAFYQEKFKMDNPNIKLIKQLEDFGAKFIACGQAMHFIDLKKESLLPVVKVALTAQTVLSTYQLKGFVLYKLW